MSPFNRTTATLLTGLVFLLTSNTGAKGDDSAQQLAVKLLKTELPAKATAVTDRVARGPVRYVSEIEYDYAKPDPAKHDKVRVTIKRDGKKYLAVSEQLGGPTKIDQKCQGYNGYYYFELKKNRQLTAWLLSSIHGTEMIESGSFKSAQGQDLIETVDQAAASVNQVLTTDGFKPLAAFPDLPGFRVLACSHDKATGRTSISFAFAVTDPVSKQQAESACELEIDSALPCLSYKLTQKHDLAGAKAVHAWQHAWSKSDSGYTGTAVLDSTRTEKGQPSTASYRAAIELATSALPDADFRLAGFGLPEPPGFEAAATPLYAWLLGIAAVCLASYFAFRFLASRRSAA